MKHGERCTSVPCVLVHGEMNANNTFLAAEKENVLKCILISVVTYKVQDWGTSWCLLQPIKSHDMTGWFTLQASLCHVEKEKRAVL